LKELIIVTTQKIQSQYVLITKSDSITSLDNSCGFISFGSTSHCNNFQ